MSEFPNVSQYVQHFFFFFNITSFLIYDTTGSSKSTGFSPMNKPPRSFCQESTWIMVTWYSKTKVSFPLRGVDVISQVDAPLMGTVRNKIQAVFRTLFRVSNYTKNSTRRGTCLITLVLNTQLRTFWDIKNEQDDSFPDAVNRKLTRRALAWYKFRIETIQ